MAAGLGDGTPHPSLWGSQLVDPGSRVCKRGSDGGTVECWEGVEPVLSLGKHEERQALGLGQWLLQCDL